MLSVWSCTNSPTYETNRKSNEPAESTHDSRKQDKHYNMENVRKQKNKNKTDSTLKRQTVQQFFDSFSIFKLHYLHVVDKKMAKIQKHFKIAQRACWWSNMRVTLGINHKKTDDCGQNFKSESFILGYRLIKKTQERSQSVWHRKRDYGHEFCAAKVDRGPDYWRRATELNESQSIGKRKLDSARKGT